MAVCWVRWFASIGRNGKKEFRPLTYWSKTGWQRKSWPCPAPLFNLQVLAERPDAPVMVVGRGESGRRGQ